MATPLFVFQSTLDTISQDSAPSYATAKDIFISALNHALATISPSKTMGIGWIGPGPRVTRKVHDGVLPGGIMSTVWILGYDGVAPGIITEPTAYSEFIADIASDIAHQMAAEPVTEANIRPPVVTGPVAAYDAARNGPLSFWTSSQAGSTHTRDAFPQTNALGTPSADQFENPIGPSDPSIVPIAPPSATPDIAGALKTLAVTVGVVGVVYVVIAAISAARSTSPLRYGNIRGGSRYNPATRHNPGVELDNRVGKFQQDMAALYAKHGMLRKDTRFWEQPNGQLSVLNVWDPPFAADSGYGGFLRDYRRIADKHGFKFVQTKQGNGGSSSFWYEPL